MQKRFELLDPKSCLNKAAPDEPVFVLRANDPLFAATVRLWAAMAHETHSPEKVNEAHNAAAEGEKWFDDRQPKAISQAIGSVAVSSSLGSIRDTSSRY